MIRKTDFITFVARDHGVTLEYAEDMVNAVFSTLGRLLFDEKESVAIGKFGRFEQRYHEPRRYKHPGSGEFREAPRKRYIKYVQPTKTIDTSTRGEKFW